MNKPDKVNTHDRANIVNQVNKAINSPGIMYPDLTQIAIQGFFLFWFQEHVLYDRKKS